MNADAMPKELVEVEKRLRGRVYDEPTAELRERVMRTVAAELAKPRQASFFGEWDVGAWAAVAAGVLVVLNLSMISASQNEYSIRPAHGANQMLAEIRALQRLEAQQEGSFK